jgi:hypothetical protein
MKRFTSIAAAVFTAAFLTAATASAQDSNVDQRTFLTFSGPVQMPGITLPAGKYVFKLAPTALHNVMQVFDGEEKHIMGQWFFVPANRTTEEQSHADGKPVVMFREMPEGMTPAIHFFFYPTDLTGKEFIYPKDQAVKIAAATHESVLATDSEVGKGDAHVFRVEPNGTEAQVEASASASTATTPEATGTTGSTASLNSQADTNNSPASGPPSYSTPQTTTAQATTAQSNNENTNVEQQPQPTGTSGAYDQNPAPRQQASAELPKTASPLPLIGLFGLLTLLAGFGFRLARNEN